MPVRGKPVLWIAFSLFALTAAIASSQPPDLTYHTVAPCAVVNTILAGGVFAPNEARTYQIVGSGSLASQGGSSSGCGIPGFSNNIPQVQAVAVNIIAVNPTGAGNLYAYAAGTTAGPSVINFTLGENVANTMPVAVAQAPGIGDFKITVNVSSAHVIVSVVGYYSKDVQTVHVHPVPGDATASGTRLLNALAGITNASATKRYVIKVEPGIYDVGTAGLQMKSFVDVEGSGQNATVIQGLGSNDQNFTTAVVQGASSCELRDVQLKSTGTPSLPYAIALLIPGADTRVRNVAINSSGGNVNWGIRNLNGSPVIEEVDILVQGGSTGYGIVGTGGSGSSLVVRRTTIQVVGANHGQGIFRDLTATSTELRDVQIRVSGGVHASGIKTMLAGPFLITITGSTIEAEGSSDSYGINFDGGGQVKVEQSRVRASGNGFSYGINGIGSLTVNHSEIIGATATVEAVDAKIGATLLDGGPAFATCAGVYDESYTFFASTCP